MTELTSLEVHQITVRLIADKTKEGIQTWNYVKKLKALIVEQQALNTDCITKLVDMGIQLEHLKSKVDASNKADS